MIAVLMALGCQDGGEVRKPGGTDIETGTAVIATVAPDYSVGALATVDLESYEAQEELAAVSGDPALALEGGYLWQLNRYMHDTVRKYDPSDISIPLAEVSVAPDSGSSNPHDIALCGDTVLVSQYELPELLLLDLDGLAVTGRIDLSQFAEDGNPEASTLVKHDGSVFVGMQNLDRDGPAWVGTGGAIAEIGCDSLAVERSWDFGNNLRLYPWEEGEGILVATESFGSLLGGVYRMDTEEGSFELLAGATAGKVSSVAAMGSSLMSIEAAEDLSGYQISCHDLAGGDSITHGIQGEYLVGAAADSSGRAWILSNFGWVDPLSFVGLYVYDMETCSEVDASPIPFGLGPYSIAIIE